jgi:DoxX-like family
MTTKTINIINWVLAGLVAFIFIGSAYSKLTANADALKMGAGFGISANSFTALGIIEIISAILFLVPRTAVLGTLLLVAYMGGAIATHLEHGQPLLAPCMISAFVWIVAIVRLPELRSRLFGK